MQAAGWDYGGGHSQHEHAHTSNANPLLLCFQQPNGGSLVHTPLRYP